LYTAVKLFGGVSSTVLTGLGIRHIVVASILSFVRTLTGGNSSSLMLDFRHPVVFQTDPSFLGYGAVCSDYWFAGASAPNSLIDYDMSLYPHNWCTAGHAIDHSLCSNINFLELFPVLLAACRSGSRWSNRRVCVETDNTQAMTFINKGYCKPKTRWLCLGFCYYMVSVITVVYLIA